MSFNQTPLKWSSVFRPVIYEHNYDTSSFTSVTDVSGYARFNLALTTSLTGIRRIYIASGTYVGWHIVTAVTATTITTSTVYTATASGTLKIIEDTQFEIYVGYDAGEYSDVNPERLIATIQPTPNLAGELIFDISSYLKSAWANDGYAPMIAPPVEGIDVNMSTPYRVATLGRAAADGDTYYALYSTIDSGLLNSFDVDGISLTVLPPVVFSCGCSIISQITDTVIDNTVTCDGEYYTEILKNFQDGTPFFFQNGEIYDFN